MTPVWTLGPVTQGYLCGPLTPIELAKIPLFEEMHREKDKRGSGEMSCVVLSDAHFTMLLSCCSVPNGSQSALGNNNHT